jgi:hypothetical protein
LHVDSDLDDCLLEINNKRHCPEVLSKTQNLLNWYPDIIQNNSEYKEPGTFQLRKKKAGIDTNHKMTQMVNFQAVI